MWRLIVTTGMRRGEVLGLRWSDVDLDATTLTVTNQRAVAGGPVAEGAPKTEAGARATSLDTRAGAALKAWKKAQNAERLLMGAGWHAGNYAFTHGGGSPLWP